MWNSNLLHKNVTPQSQSHPDIKISQICKVSNTLMAIYDEDLEKKPLYERIIANPTLTAVGLEIRFPIQRPKVWILMYILK